MDLNTFILGMIIFFARICDVAVGTVRTIVTVQGRTGLSFVLGVIEVTIWITMVSTVVSKVKESPVLIIFFALGFATGNVVGIIVERKLAFGTIILRIITLTQGKSMADHLRKIGQPVTTFIGEGMTGQITELCVACNRRDLKLLLPIVREEDPYAFYITERTDDVSKILRPFHTPITGWRAVFKKK
jgi:uncharacterized protein YebE (UPF0316 family)